MKIYEIGTGYTPIPAQISAATEIVVEELTKAFLKQDVSVEILDIVSDSRADNQLPIREVKVPKCFSGTDVQLGIMHKLKRIVYSVALASELRKILQLTEEKVVLHFHNQYNLFFFNKLVSKPLREKAVIAYTNHSGIWRLPWNEIKDTVRKRYFQEAECMKQADIVFLLNEETKKSVMEHLGVPKKRIVLINNGVNTDIYHPLTEADKQAAKNNWDLQGKRVILQVGSVYENKGQLRSLEYILPILKEDSDVVFAYAGGIVDEAYQTAIQQYAVDHGIVSQVKYLGVLSPGIELNRLFNTARLTIFPSHYEAFGLVVIESFSAGVPVLVNKKGNIRLGEGTILFDPAHVVNTITPYLSNDEHYCATLSEVARNNAVKNYSWTKVANDYLSAFINRMEQK